MILVILPDFFLPLISMLANDSAAPPEVLTQNKQDGSALVTMENRVNMEKDNVEVTLN